MVACRAAALPSSEKQKRLSATRAVAFIRFLLAGLADQAEQLSFACPLLCRKRNERVALTELQRLADEGEIRRSRGS